MFQQIWTPRAIREYILYLEGREPLNSYYCSTTYPALYAAAERIFGSWGEAIVACGLDYDKIRKYQRWSPEKVVEKILDMAKRHEPLHSQHIQDNFRPLYLAALRRFGSWGKAISASGLDYDEIRLRRSWTVKQVRKAIMELYRNGEDLAAPNMREHFQYLLAAGSKRLGNGSWSEARKACGIEDNFRLPIPRRRDKTKAELRDERRAAAIAAGKKVRKRAGETADALQMDLFETASR